MSDENLHQLVGDFLRRFGLSNEGEQVFAVELYQQLAAGKPVSKGQMAEALSWPEAKVVGMFDELPSVYLDYDDDGNVSDWGGFGLDGGNNGFTIRGNEMFAWCAWDALFVPAVVGEPAQVTAVDPEDGAEVSLTVTPAGVENISPEGAVMTFALPGMKAFPRFKEFSFQRTVHFFGSEKSAENWLAKNPGPELISLEEGFELGRTMNRIRFPDIPRIAELVGTPRR